MAERVQRWFRRFDTAPRDGTAFVIGHMIRRNPIGDHWEALCLDPESGERSWQPFDFPSGRDPKWWCPLLPLDFELPNKGWFKMTYQIEAVEAITNSFIARCFERFGWRAK